MSVIGSLAMLCSAGGGPIGKEEDKIDGVLEDLLSHTCRVSRRSEDLPVRCTQAFSSLH